MIDNKGKDKINSKSCGVTTLNVHTVLPFCLQCEYARFPAPEEQCYKTGGLICQIDQTNVGKYSNCRFAERPLLKNK